LREEKLILYVEKYMSLSKEMKSEIKFNQWKIKAFIFLFPPFSVLFHPEYVCPYMMVYDLCLILLYAAYKLVG
jgi:hypothetical protein